MPASEAQDCVNGERHAMEVDGGGSSLEAAPPPDSRDSKRLRRGVLAGEPLPTLASAEHSFVGAVLDGCSHPDQRRFAMEYRKWIEGVAIQQP